MRLSNKLVLSPDDEMLSIPLQAYTQPMCPILDPTVRHNLYNTHRTLAEHPVCLPTRHQELPQSPNYAAQHASHSSGLCMSRCEKNNSEDQPRRETRKKQTPTQWGNEDHSTQRWRPPTLTAQEILWPLQRYAEISCLDRSWHLRQEDWASPLATNRVYRWPKSDFAHQRMCH